MAEIKWTTNKDQQYYDSWRKVTRTLQYKGRCVLCGRRTYAFTDGDNDPRGILGDHAASPLIAKENDATGADVPACFLCQNDTAEKYHLLMAKAYEIWGNKAEARYHLKQS